MKIIDVVQGSPAWLAIRASHLCASDAPVMMGASKHTKRSELVRMKATGAEKEFSEWAQKNLIDKGHGVEAGARAIVEEMIDEELYPVTGSCDAGRFLASFDGLPMATRVGFEHKLWNQELAAAIRANATEFPGGLEWQLEQQILVGGLEKVIFVCSNGTKEKFEHLEYRAVPGRAAQLVAAWDQFEEDVKAYTHVEVLPAPTARAIKDLPILSVQLVGKVKASNLEDYKQTALAFIRNINTDLQTDQDFADAEKTVKFCGDAEGRLEDVKEQALAQTASIAELFSTLDQLREEMRGKRLELEKLVEARKKTIRADILRGGQAALVSHIAMLNQRLCKTYMPVVLADFAGAMKNKRTIASLRDAVDTELAKAKISANAIADKIGVNLNTFRDLASEHTFLFADLSQLVLKETEDFATLVKMRIADHKAKEELRRAAVQPTPATQPAPVSPPVPAKPAGPLSKARPTDEQIIAVLAAHFNAHESRVVGWLMEMNLDAAIERVSAEPITS